MNLSSAPRRAITGRSAVTNASYVATAEVVAKLSTLAWTVVAAQQLGQFGFGAFNLALAAGLVLTAMGQWGFNSVFVRRASRDTSRLSQYFTEVAVWQAGLATPLLVLGVMVFAVLTPDPVAVAASGMVLLAVLCDMVSDTARGAASTVHRQGTTSAALIAQRLLTAATAIPATVAWGSVLALSAAFLTSSVVGVVLHFVALRRLDIRFSPRLLTRKGMRQAFAGTSWIGLGSVIQSLQYRAGFILIAAFFSEAAVGSYAAAFRLFETVLFLSFALVAAVFPLMSVARTPAELRQLAEASVSVLTGFYLPFAVVCLIETPRLVRLVFGEEYVVDSTGPLRWFSLAPLLFAVSYVSGTALVALSRTKRLFVSTVFATATAMGLSLLLIPFYGPAGAAIGLTAALAVDATLTTVFLRRSLDKWPRFVRQAAQPVLCTMLVVAILLILDAPFVVELSVSALVYVGCWGALLRWSRSSAARLIQTIPGAGEAAEGDVQETADRSSATVPAPSPPLAEDALPGGEQPRDLR